MAVPDALRQGKLVVGQLCPLGGVAIEVGGGAALDDAALHELVVLLLLLLPSLPKSSSLRHHINKKRQLTRYGIYSTSSFSVEMWP